MLYSALRVPLEYEGKQSVRQFWIIRLCVHVLKADISLLVLVSISDMFRNGPVSQVEQPSTDEEK